MSVSRHQLEIKKFSICRLTVTMFGLSARAFHLTNLALHWMVVALLYDTSVTTLRIRPTTSLAAAALFAVHPVHSEAVSTNIITPEI